MDLVSAGSSEDGVIVVGRASSDGHLQSEKVKQLVHGRNSDQLVTWEQLRACLAVSPDLVMQSIARTLDPDCAVSRLDLTYITRNQRGRFKDYDTTEMKPEFNDLIAPATKSKLQGLATPPYLIRAFTCQGPRHTNGHTTRSLFLPSAAIGGRMCHESIWHILVNELAAMFGTHLAWDDRIQDELLSWTDSWLFALVHLYLRHLKGQGVAYLACIDCRKARKVDEKTKHTTQPIEVFSALALASAVKLHSHELFRSPIKSSALVAHKFTHEYITHGVVEYAEYEPLGPVSWEDLVDNGLFKLLPEMQIPSDMRAQGLWEVNLYIRRENYSGNFWFIKDNELSVAEQLALLHSQHNALVSKDAEQVRQPHLAILLHYLSLRKRSPEDKVLQSRIRALGYQRADLDDLLYDGYEKIPDNLPEKYTYLDLMRNVQAVVGGAPLLQTVLIHKDPDLGFQFLQSESTFKAAAKLCYDPYRESKMCKNGNGEVNYEDRGLRCGHGCDCTIWNVTIGSLTQLRYTRRVRRSWNRGFDDTDDDDSNDDDEPSRAKGLEEKSKHSEDEAGSHFEDDDDGGSEDLDYDAANDHAIFEQELRDLEQESEEYVQKKCAEIKQELEHLENQLKNNVSNKDDHSRSEQDMPEEQDEYADNEVAEDMATQIRDVTPKDEPEDATDSREATSHVTMDSMLRCARVSTPLGYERKIRKLRRYNTWRVAVYDPPEDHDSDVNDIDYKATGSVQSDQQDSPDDNIYVEFWRSIRESTEIYIARIPPKSRKMTLKRKLKELTSSPISSKAVKLETATPPPATTLKFESVNTSLIPARKSLLDDKVHSRRKLPNSPRTKTDFVIAVKPCHVHEILNEIKTHEFRKYPLPATNMWIYESVPVSAVRYFCLISPPMLPGQLDEEDLAIDRNRKFQDGQNESGVTHAHKILEVWRLEDGGVTLEEMKEEGILKGPPQRYTFLAVNAVERLRRGMVKASNWLM